MAGITHNFINPYMAACIVTPDGDRIPLGISAGAASESTDQADTKKMTGLLSLPYVSEMTVEIGLGEIPVISVTLTPPYEEGIKILDSELVEWGVNELQVQFGYVGVGQLPGVVYTGLLMAPEISIGNDITIKLNAQGAFSLQASGDTRINTTGMTNLAILASVLVGSGDQKRNITVVPNITAGTTAWEKLILSKYVVDNPLLGKTDWDTFNFLCSEMGVWPTFSSVASRSAGSQTVVTLNSRDKSLSAIPTKTFSIRDFPGGLQGSSGPVYPLLSISTDTNAVYLPGTLRGQFYSSISSRSRDVKTAALTPETVKNPGVGSAAAIGKTGKKGGPPAATSSMPGADDETGSGHERAYVDVNDSGATAVGAAAESVKRLITSMYGVTIEATSLGIPDLLPSDTITVIGASKRLNGNYAVLKTIHKIRSDGYDMSFTAFSTLSKNDPNNTQDLSGPINVTVAVPDDRVTASVAQNYGGASSQNSRTQGP